MADTIDTDEMQAVKELMETISGLSEKLNANMGKLKEISPEAFQKMSSSLENNIASLTKLDTVFNTIFNSSKALTQVFKENADVLARLGVGIAVVTGLGDAVFPVSGAFEKLGSSASESAANITENYKRATSVMKIMPNAVKEITDRLGQIAPQVDHIVKVENSLLALQARAGKLGDAFQKFGPNLTGLDQMLDNFGKSMESIGNRTGMSTSQVTDFAQKMMSIPGVMNELTSLTTEGGEQLDLYSAAIKISRGSIRDLGAVYEIVNKQVRSFGSSGEDALKVISRIHSATQSLGIPFDQMKGFVEQSANAFKFYGNQSQAALEIMNKMAPALKESGLGPDAITELVSGMVDGVKGLNIAQKAFVSAQTGGPGGLMGGYQIERDLQEGRMDKVFDKVQTALKNQFGGAIVTLEEASQNAGAAAQMARQVAFLRQGPLGSMVKSDQEAYKLLEAMKSGAGAGALKTTKEATKAALAEGEGIQKRQTTILTNISNANERMAQLMAQQLYFEARSIAGGGPEGPKVIQTLMEESKSFAAQDLAERTAAEKERSRGEAATGYASSGEATPIMAIFKDATRIGNALARSAELAGIKKTTTTEVPTMPRAATPAEASRETMAREMNTIVAQEPVAQAAIRRDINTVIASAATAMPGGAEAGVAGAAGEAARTMDHNITINYRTLGDEMKQIANIQVREAKDIEISQAQGVSGTAK